MTQQDAKFHFNFPLDNLVATQLACLRGGRVVFKNLSFSLAAGQALALTGSNGSGKTSLLRLLAGLVPKAAGRVTGLQSEQIHYIGHLNAHKMRLTVRENLAFWGAFLNAEQQNLAIPAIAETLMAAGLAEQVDLMASDLSAGQGRRLALARLMLVPRPFWLLDEPFNALDDKARHWLGLMAARHLEAGGMIIAATHDTLPFATHKLDVGTGISSEGENK